MANSSATTRFRFWIWLIRVIGVIVPRRMRADWRQEWEAELSYREKLLAKWDQLNRRAKLDLLWHSAGAFADALWLQPKRWEDEMFQDLRYGVRMLRTNQGFTAVALLSLALGIGANTAIFSLMDAIFWRPLPVSHPEQLVSIVIPMGEREDPGFTPLALLRELQNGNQVFTGAITSGADGMSLTVDGAAERVMVDAVTSNYFSELGVGAFRGRTFSAEIARGAWAPEAVLSYDFWRRRFGADASVIGKTIQLNGYPFTVVGVSPPRFFGTEVGVSPELRITELPGPIEQTMPAMLPLKLGRYVSVLARLKPDVSLQQAQAATEVIYQRLLKDDPQVRDNPRYRGTHIRLLPGQRGTSRLRDEFGRPLAILMAMVALVLLIACANLANLLLGRATARRQEIAIRLAIGAGRPRLIRQLLTESLLISLLGGALGLLLSYWAVDGLFGFLPQNHISTWLEVKPDHRALGFTFGVTLLTGILFGLAPALQATRLDLVSALKRGLMGRRRRALDLRQALVVAEVALSVLLLIGAALFVRTLQNLQAVNAGFEAASVTLFTMKHVHERYEPARIRNFCRELLERVEGLPGVRSAGLAETGPFSGREGSSQISVPGVQPQAERQTHPFRDRVSPRFFESMGIPLLAGRDFSYADQEGAPRTAIVDETVARDYFGGMNPVGRRIAIGRAPNVNEFEIIGMVKATKHKNVREAAQGAVYLSILQGDRPWMPTLFVRADKNSAQLTAAVRQTFQTLDKDLPVFNVKTFERQLNESLARDQLVATLSGFFGVLAALLAAIGLYGVMAYAVARRTREIGIRMALGAQPKSVLWLVMSEALRLVVIGMAIGVGGALMATRLISTMLFGLTPTDPLTIAIASSLFMAVAALAAYLPARRASRVDPMVVLRHE
jgi:predicted permease